MSQELKMAVKCKEPKQRTTLKRKCSTCVVSGDHSKHGYDHTGGGAGTIVAAGHHVEGGGMRAGHCQHQHQQQQQHRAEVYHHHHHHVGQSPNHVGASSSSYYHNNTYVPQGLDEPVNELYDQRSRAVSARHTPTRDYRTVSPPPSDSEHFATGASSGGGGGGRQQHEAARQGLFNNLLRKRNGCNSARCKINTGGGGGGGSGTQSQWSGKSIGLRHQQPSATFYFAPSCQYEDQDTDLQQSHHHQDQELYQQHKHLGDDCDSDTGSPPPPPMQLSTSQLVINQSNLIMAKDMVPAPPPPPTSMPPPDMCGNGNTSGGRPLSSLGYNRAVVDVECYRDRCATFAAPGSNTPGNITPSGLSRQYIEHVGSGNLNDNLDTIS